MERRQDETRGEETFAWGQVRHLTSISTSLWAASVLARRYWKGGDIYLLVFDTDPSDDVDDDGAIDNAGNTNEDDDNDESVDTFAASSVLFLLPLLLIQKTLLKAPLEIWYFRSYCKRGGQLGAVRLAGGSWPYQVSGCLLVPTRPFLNSCT